MGDDLDVDALLEAAYKDSSTGSPTNGEKGSDRNDRSEKRRRSRSRDRDRSRRHRSRSRDRRRRRSHSRSKDSRRRSRSRDRRRRSRSKDRTSRESKRKSISPKIEEKPKSPVPELTPEERDARTIFVMQLGAKVRSKDIEEFFSSVGKVTDVKLVVDTKTGRSKGIAYIEFKDVDSVALALGLSGQKLCGHPVVVQPTQAEKNRAAMSSMQMVMRGERGPMRLYVGSLHFNITEDMLRGIFEPFGKIDDIELMMDAETNRSRGYGFLTFRNAEDAKKALEQLNGFELAGRAMRVGHVTERAENLLGPSFLDSDDLDRSGVDLGATGRLQLMAKLAEGTGLQIPQQAQSALQMGPNGAMPAAMPAPPIATQCFMLSNMFNIATESSYQWDLEIRDDVLEECNKHGGALHIYVDKASPQGNVYVKCPTIATAAGSVNALHGRFFAGRVITAAYVPILNYHNLFPDALVANQLLTPMTRRF